MPKQNYTPEEQEKIKKYNDLFEAKQNLHKLLRRVVVSTKLGRQRKQPDDDIELEVGGGSIGSCGRYGQVRYYPEGVFGEYQLDDDLETINYLIKEINKRFQEFRKERDANKLEYIKVKKKFAKKFFEPPLIKINEIYDARK